MFVKLLLLFTIVPAVELALLIKIGQYVGVIPTIILVASTGIIGVSLARSQGFSTINKIKSNLNQGQMPTDDLIGGLLILIGGAFLLTPGLLTDTTGFLLILPGTRHIFARIIKIRFVNYFKKNGFSVNYNKSQDFYSNQSNHYNDDDFIDIDADNYSSDDGNKNR